MRSESKPYVVSADVSGLMNKWSAETGYQLPNEDFFQGIAGDLQSTLEEYFPQGVEVVDEQELKSGLMSLAEQNETPIGQKLPIISLDRAYADRSTPNLIGYLDVTRGVNEDLEDCGLKPRPGSETVDAQFDKYKNLGINSAILLDDVVFSGDGIRDIIDQFEKRNIHIDRIIAGIGIRTVGANGGLHNLRNSVDVDCVQEFEEVIDEVCQRDFVAGVPMSGRSIYLDTGEVESAPYFSPFGNAEEWASIPTENDKDFSEFCLGTSIDVFNEIEQISQSSVPTSAIPRVPRGIGSHKSFKQALIDVKNES